MYRVVRTDNFDRDGIAEEFASPILSHDGATIIANVLNEELSGETERDFWKVVKLPYALHQGFEP